jgi:hypothetical protein
LATEKGSITRPNHRKRGTVLGADKKKLQKAIEAAEKRGDKKGAEILRNKIPRAERDAQIMAAKARDEEFSRRVQAGRRKAMEQQQEGRDGRQGNRGG